MGDNAVILSGVESEASKASLYSTVHGAGRVMSRTEARGKWRKGVQRTEGRIRHDDWQRGCATKA
jgi:tRNA-splicing ligase RtcB (3'-phosphate/5'-hydroxy nucleic acid ligase)